MTATRCTTPSPPLPGAPPRSRPPPATCAPAAAASACTCATGNGPEVRYIEGNPEHPLNKGVLCAKGSSGIMKQYSPARLTQPLRRKPGTERGAGAVRADRLGRDLLRC
jgi:anaerobic selenocysteine-containing dehydrogenase